MLDPEDDAGEELPVKHADADDQPAPAPMTHPAGEPGGKPPEALQSDHAHPDLAAAADGGDVDLDASPLPEPSLATAPASTLAAPHAFDASGENEDASAPRPVVEPAPTSSSLPGEAGERDWEAEYTPYSTTADEPAPRSRWPLLLIATLLLIGLIAAALWFLAPAEFKQRVGLAETGETPLLLQVEQHSRQQLASGNQLLEVSGRVINPTEKPQRVPPLQAQLRSAEQQIVYRWTIPPPARTLAAGGSATFNSAELNIPSSAACLDVSFGAPDPKLQKPCQPMQAADPQRS